VRVQKRGLLEEEREMWGADLLRKISQRNGWEGRLKRGERKGESDDFSVMTLKKEKRLAGGAGRDPRPQLVKTKAKLFPVRGLREIFTAGLSGGNREIEVTIDGKRGFLFCRCNEESEGGEKKKKLSPI